ncbi:MAG TPA: hypothetical protein PKA64_08910, partial [Myxococcota bacterium]|nr:hypothetical protein [Myxococcota bacterium]
MGSSPPARTPPPPPPLALTITPLIPGQPMHLAITGAAPGQTVHLVRSHAGEASGAASCLPSGACVDLAPPIVLTWTGTADAQGRARMDLQAFPNMPARETWFQAIASSPAPTASPVVYQPIRDAACDAIDDSREDDDTPQTAAPLIPGMHVGLQCAFDDDWSSYELPAGAGLDVTVWSDPGGAPSSVELWVDGARVATGAPSGALQALHWRNDATLTQAVLVRKRGTGSAAYAVLTEELEPLCGNGQLDAGETCDLSAGLACACDDGVACTDDTIVSGHATTCDVTCAHALSPTPACAVCGDGVVSGDETCESAPTDPSDACPTLGDCPDDGDPCTAPTLTGPACGVGCSVTNHHGQHGYDTCDDGDACTIDAVLASDPAICSMTCSHARPPDPFDDGFADSNCDGIDGDMAHIVFAAAGADAA